MTIEQAKTYLWISGNDKDSEIQLILDGVLALFWKYIWKSLKLNESITEYYSGGSERHIFLRNYPVNSVASVKVNTGTGRDPIWTDIDNDYVIQEKKGMITLLEGRVLRWYKNIQIIYSAWYADDAMPDDLVMAVLEMVKILWNKKLMWASGKSSESIDDYSVTFTNDDMSDTIKNILSSYKKFYV